MKRLWYVPIIVLVLSVQSCKDNSVGNDPANQIKNGTISLVFDSAPNEIVQVIATLSRHGFDTRTLSLALSDSNHSASGTFNNVAAGVWHLKVDALDDSSRIRYSGEKDVEVLEGQTSQVFLELLPVDGSIEIHVTWVTMPHNRGLVLYMPFTGTTTDSSGHQNHGRSSNASYTTDKWGNPSSAYLFNGSDNFITVANSSSLKPTRQLTIAFWIRVDRITNNISQLVSKTEGAPADPLSTTREYQIELKDNFDYPLFKLFSAGDGLYQHEVNTYGYGGFLMGQWHYFVGVIDRVNHRMRIYVDNILCGDVADSYSSFNTNNHPLLIGSGEETWEQFSPFAGAMDELRIYTRALSTSEIDSLYHLER